MLISVACSHPHHTAPGNRAPAFFLLIDLPNAYAYTGGMEFKHIITEARKRSGLSQSELADRADSGRVFIAQLESGERDNPSLDVLKRLCKALGPPFARDLSAYFLEASGKRKKSRK